MNKPDWAERIQRSRRREYDKGVFAERESRNAWLNRVRTWYPEKANIWCEGYEVAVNDIIKLLEDTAIKNGKGTKAIHWHLDKLIALIKGENK